MIQWKQHECCYCGATLTVNGPAKDIAMAFQPAGSGKGPYVVACADCYTSRH